MARLLTNAELWSHVTAVGVIRDVSGGGSTTIATTALAVGDTAVTLAAASSFANDDLIRIGDESNEEVAVIESGGGTTSLVLSSGVAYAHAVGEAVVEQERTVLGDVADDGIDVEYQADRTQVNAATRRERLAFLIGNVNARMTFDVRNHSLENVAATLGVSEGNITGAGSAADPSVMDATPDDWDEQANQSFYFTGALKNGTTVEIQLWRTSVDPNKTVTYARGGSPSLPFAVDVGHVRYYSPVAPA